MTKRGGVLKHRNPLSQISVFMLSSGNVLLAASDPDAGVPRLYEDFSSNNIPTPINDLFLRKGVREILEGQYYCLVI